MSFTATVHAADLEFEVSLTWDSYGDTDIDDITLNGEAVDVSGLYIKQNEKFVSLEEYLFEQANERLDEEGGPSAIDREADGEARMDARREEAA